MTGDGRRREPRDRRNGPGRRSLNGIGVGRLACRLPPDRLGRRRAGLARGLAGAIGEVRELEDGYAFRLPSDDRWIARAARFMVTERRCCPFFRFELVVESNGGPTWLRLRGGSEVKEYVAALMPERVGDV